jgi:F-type H+-transporting ATPase subunit b
VEFDATFWAFVGFVIFAAILVYVKVPGMIAGQLDSRADAIRTELAQAKRLREEAEALLADYRKRAREAEAEAEGIVSLARHEAEVLAKESQQRIADYVERRTRAAEVKIAQAEAQALQEVKSLSADVAIAAAEKIIAGRTRGAEGEKLIGRSIGEIKSRLN